MAVFVALLRAVNVGGTGKLPMSVLVAMAQSAGFRDVRTYIASGNLLFEYVHYGEGMARSRLRIPAAKTGTARNINTGTRLAAMAGT